MADKVYLRRPGDETNLIEVDAAEVKVSFNGERQWFKRHEIVRIQVRDIREIPALAAGILMGVLGFLGTAVSVPLGMVMMAAGALAFHVGMEWQRRLVITLDSRLVYTLTFFTRGVRDICAALAKYGYLGEGRFRLR